MDNDLPLYLFHQGTNFRAYDFLGAHFTEDKSAVIFRTWAPNAERVSVVGDFNGWDESKNVMTRISGGGVYEAKIKGLKTFDAYKFAVRSKNKTVLKADPYAFHSETPPGTASKIYDLDGYIWHDEKYMAEKQPPYSRPMNIYEVNLASFKRHDDGNYYTYTEYATELVDYVADMGFTHVEIMPVSEFPFDGSWGYQVTGYYSITSRFGLPKEFMYLVDRFHERGIGVILDWVPAHFPKDEHGLYEFEGTACYENGNYFRKEHKAWGTRIFDWARNEVRSFLISNALFLMEKYHVDGLRVDAVASMLYLDYDKRPGEWQPNADGGNYDVNAIEFLKKLNSVVFEKFPDALMIAEESTAFPMITKPVYSGGLGFNFKWNMGWMNDTLAYMQSDPYFRAGIHDKLTFSMFYAFSENFVLPISHDEVVHGKKSLIDKMPGNTEEKFSNLRTFMMYMYAHPGKKLLFMGTEFAQFKEWDYKSGLEFFMLKFDLHEKFQKFIKRLNGVYKSVAAFYEADDSWDGFSWISADDRARNVVSFVRRDKKGNQVVAVMNFSGNEYLDYKTYIPAGAYDVLLCSDDVKFGGKGVFRKRIVRSVKKRKEKESSAAIVLPRFSALFLIKQ